MNRRSFLKSGALWVPQLFAVGLARGQVLTLSDHAMLGRARRTSQNNGLLTSLSAYWGMNEASDGSGNVTREDSHGTADLTDNNSTPAGAGIISNGCDFESSNTEYLSSTDNAVLSVGSGVSFSFSCWVKLESKAVSPAYNMIVNKIGASTTTNEYSLSYRGSVDRFQWSVGRDGDAGTLDTVNADNLGSPSTGTWYHIVAWYDVAGDVIGIAVNAGTANTAAKTIDPPDGTATFYIGRASSGQYFDGIIDEVGMWKRALSNSDRTALYNSGSGLAYSSFD